ncbi:hypothetical protein NW762_011970 [Fusarium torreyae]|uniref:WW domain-containing protein n=1 Tax=Fusarium torreyae TaxID=1237075 RepID=A0A9W8RPU4_9HYPO|nr:hypothetical protein NW762_011970 [Fusarium torreyae]
MATARPRPFKYQHLKEGEVRVLDLKPGRYEDPLRVRMISGLLSPGARTIPSFEGLSYVWEDASGKTEIIIEEDDGILSSSSQYKVSAAPPNADKAPQIPERTFSIGRNLADALRHLRQESGSRIIWADALCINQNDPEERASQILRMGDIYTLAQRVIVWLGPEAANSNIAIDAIERLSAQIDFSTFDTDAKDNTLNVEYGCDAWVKDRNMALPLTQAEWRAIADFLSRNWFKRLWVRQEITLANSNAIVMAGGRIVEWNRLVGATILIHSNEALPLVTIPDNIAFKRAITNVTSFRKIKAMRGFDSLIMATYQCKCSDDRDRVYGLLGIIDPSMAAKITPDYTKPAINSYSSLALAAIEYYQRLDILNLCESAREPTWVPDFANLKSHAARGRRSWAAGWSGPSFKVLPGGRIEVHGIHCDHITERVGSVAKDCSDDEVKLAIMEAATQCLGRNSELWDPKQHEYFTKACMDGQTFESAEWFNYPTLSQSASVLKEWVTASGSVSDCRRLDERRTMDIMREFVSGRTIYKTVSGAFILGPNQCRLGDLLYVLLGSSHLSILRPKNSDSGAEFHILGSVFHSLFSLGEALCGELQDGWRAVEGNVSGTVTFKKEGVPPQGKDPRMSHIQLPAGWGEAEDDNSWPYWYRNEEKNKKVWGDPRLVKDELRSRGINVVEIIIA